MTLGKAAGSKIKKCNLLLVLVKKCKEPKPKDMIFLTFWVGFLCVSSYI